MRLFHVSEESDIEIFIPRIPDRDDLDKSVGLVWAIDEKRLPNFLTPRNCPRVTYHKNSYTTEEDSQKFFSSPSVNHAVVIENNWYEIMKKTKLYIYEFDCSNFKLQDETAGYYVSTVIQKPIAKYVIEDLFVELINRNIEIRITDNLHSIANDVKRSSLNWSLCRMAYAKNKIQEVN